MIPPRPTAIPNRLLYSMFSAYTIKKYSIYYLAIQLCARGLLTQPCTFFSFLVFPRFISIKCSLELRQWCICKKCKEWNYESWSLQSVLERLCSLKQLSNGVLKGNKTEELERRKLAVFFSCIRFQQLVKKNKLYLINGLF